jgi:hypothetical protein
MGDSPAVVAYDAAGNALLGAKTKAGSIPVVLPSDNTPISNPTDTTGTIVAGGGTVAVAIQGYSSCAVVITGTWAATLVFEFSHDGGSTWTIGGFVQSPTGAEATSPYPSLMMTVAANGSYQTIGMGPTTNVRIRAAAYTSGTVSVRLVFSSALPSMLTAFVAAHQDVSPSIYNNSTTNLAAAASFTGTSAESLSGAGGIQVNVIADQGLDVTVYQSSDGTNWDHYDSWDILAGQASSHVIQAVALFFRVVVRNIGNATTTYFRLQTLLVPIVNPMPRSLTPQGKLKLASMTTDWAPSDHNWQDRSEGGRALLMDVDRNLNVRARCLTDEQSFRDDFPGSTPYTDLTGTVYFTTGRTEITGVGTAFLSQIRVTHYIKLSSHADSVYAQVSDVLSDTHLILEDAYAGATGNGTGRISTWLYNTGSGATISQTGSEFVLASGVTSGADSYARRVGDYLPYSVLCRARISQRVANQTARLGLADGVLGSEANQAVFIFDGTTNTVVKTRTGNVSGETEENTVTLPGSVVSSTVAYYAIEVLPQRVVFWINDYKVAEHKLHIPGPYSVMDLWLNIKNTAAVTTTTFAADLFAFNNFDQIQIADHAKGDPIPTKEYRSQVSSCTNVSAAVADTVLLAQNQTRLGAAIYNDSTAVCYLKLGLAASTSSFTIALGRYEYYEVPFSYTGPINGYWTAATGTARITEVS